MKLTVVRRLAVVVEEEAALTKFAAAVIAWMMNAALKAAIPPIRSEHHACIHVHRVSHYWSPIGHHVCTYILELTSSTLYPVHYIYQYLQHDKECIKDECKNKYCKDAGKCKYGDKDDWKKVVDRKCNVEW